MPDASVSVERRGPSFSASRLRALAFSCFKLLYTQAHTPLVPYFWEFLTCLFTVVTSEMPPVGGAAR